MEENEIILENWYKTIESFTKLRYDEAKSLFIDMSNETDNVKKQKIRERLINGTLYIIYYNLKNYGLSAFKSSVYDMNDIISVSTMIWINIIDSGKLLEKNCFSDFFTITYFYGPLYSILVPEQKNNCGLEYFELAELIDWFINKRDKNGIISYHEFKYHVTYYKCDMDDKYMHHLYDSLNGFYDYCFDNGVYLDNISKTKLVMLRNFILDIGNNYNRENIDNFKVNYGVMDGEPTKGDIDYFVKELLKLECLTSNEKKALIERFDLNGNGETKTYGEVAKSLNVTIQAIGFMLKRVYRKSKKGMAYQLRLNRDPQISRVYGFYSNND